MTWSKYAYPTSRIRQLEDAVNKLKDSTYSYPKYQPCHECGCVTKSSKMSKVVKRFHYRFTLTGGSYTLVYLYCQWCAPEHDTETQDSEGNWVCTKTETVEVDCGKDC